MGFSEDLAVVKTQATDTGRFKAEAVKAFHAELKPFRDAAIKCVAEMDKHHANEVLPFISEVSAAQVDDHEMTGWLFELRTLGNASGQVRAAIAESEKIGWDDMASSVFPDELNAVGRLGLISHFTSRFNPGDVIKRRVMIMGMIRTKVKELADARQLFGNGRRVTMSPPDRPAPSVSVTTNFDPRRAR